MFPAPTGALESALTLGKRILTCFWKHTRWWWWVQDASRCISLDCQMFQLLWHLRRSAGDFENSWDLCTSSAGDIVPYSHTSGSLGSITTKHFIHHIGPCYSHKLCYIIIWHVLSMSIYIYTYWNIGI
jgi:hypothetical protein